MKEKERKAGLLLHISSLPSKYGVGTLGEEAYHFVDWLKKAKLKIWQVLPIVPTNYGDSPYQSVSSTALNYYFIDFDILREKGLLKLSDYKDVKLGYEDNKVDYSLLFNGKIEILYKAFLNFDSNNKDFLDFVAKGEYKDFAVFMTIKKIHNYISWDKWDKTYQNYSKELEEGIINDYYKEYLFWVWTQYEFLDEWNKLHKYANDNGIEIMGDMPLYIAYDSVEVWMHPEMFLLDQNKVPTLVAGCPPDAFTEDGQLWGNPIYNWQYMKDNGYKWWNERISKAFVLYDILRIDHFRGFDRYYAIPYGHVNARKGSWLDGPKFDLFKDKLDLNIVAEDLGTIDEGVRTLMKQVGYPGMKIIEFAFDGHSDNEHKPSNYTNNYIVYTGTHDNMPLYQYILDLKEEELEIYYKDLEKECELLNVKYLGEEPHKLVECVIELAYASKADTCIIPMQDLLCQDGKSRMNLPSTVSTDNWSYRILKENLSDELALRLASLVTKYRR